MSGQRKRSVSITTPDQTRKYWHKPKDWQTEKNEETHAIVSAVVGIFNSFVISIHANGLFLYVDFLHIYEFKYIRRICVCVCVYVCMYNIHIGDGEREQKRSFESASRVPRVELHGVSGVERARDSGGEKMCPLYTSLCMCSDVYVCLCVCR